MLPTPARSTGPRHRLPTIGYAPPGSIGDGQYGDGPGPEPVTRPEPVVEPIAETPAPPAHPTDRPPLPVRPTARRRRPNADSPPVTARLPAVPLRPQDIGAPADPATSGSAASGSATTEPDEPSGSTADAAAAQPDTQVWLGAALVLGLLLIAVLLAWAPWS